MKANELRIGNWILDEDKEENQIEHLQPIYGYAYRWEWLKYYKPITLTEDWLIKFGFKKLPHSWSCDIFHLTEWDKFPLSWCVAFNKNNAIIVSKLKHVHQLQNLYFALTQKELTF